MTTKVIYFTVGERGERAEFNDDSPADDVKDTFRAAAEAGPNDILKLYNAKGNIVNISPKLDPNPPDQPYKLEVVATQCTGNIGTHLGFDIDGLESRLQHLEKKMMLDGGETPSVVYDVRNKVEQFREKLENVEHLSWLGLFKDISSGTSLDPFWNRQNTHRKSAEHNRRVFEKYLKITNIQVTDEVKMYLRKPTFDNWQWEDAEMLVLLQQMYIDLDFTTKFNIELPVLQEFLYEVYKNYNQIPFHNFRHCFCVSQMMYGLAWLVNMTEQLGHVDVLIMLTSAICHDLDHPGYNNAYQVNARTELALRYNDISPPEN
ncbi:PREDICTED: high affinity cGMP-specific 3',5'-cyclic phosphodiesterase 9A-like, partial [Priapulus caudatus]|uniref:High affinity cGMP-specific 3',5'-cyclic phosphodiesterase 9A-like n=1 Tax=Priapulus caudatus TaxID=37621 RepID=A0ABM1EIZ3_PRICU